MRRDTGAWDVRAPATLKALFPKAKRRGWWYKVDRVVGRQVLEALAAEYGVRAPQLATTIPTHERGGRRINGEYHPRTETIVVHGRSHLKTYFHEFYHHLDHVTRLYNSTDRLQLAWKFADLMWDAFRQ